MARLSPLHPPTETPASLQPVLTSSPQGTTPQDPNAMDPSQQHPQARPRSKSNFSFHSDKSRDSQPNRAKHERNFSNGEKRKTHYDPTTKANPNAAMNEAQPIAAALEKPTLQSLRSFQHNDTQGNPIVDPDLSNPTRSRWERPLDTIRSFEAAIDSEYRRRAQSVRADQTDVMSGYNSRRSSYYGGGYEQAPQNRYSRNSYYGQRQGDYENGYGQGGPVRGPPQRMRYNNRMQSDPGFNQNGYGQNVYPTNGYQQSRDTVHTNGSNGSHSDGPYSNDPSSDNSSFERGTPVGRHHQQPAPPPPDMGEQYGFSGFGKIPAMDPYTPGSSNNYGYFPPHQGPQVPSHNGPPPPPKHATLPQSVRPVQKLTSSPSAAGGAGRPNMLSKTSSGDDKRKSWFKRRFSKD